MKGTSSARPGSGIYQIMLRNGKGGKDRVAVLPDPVAEPLRRKTDQVRIIHERDTSKGFGEVYLLFALKRKHPKAAKAFFSIHSCCALFIYGFLRGDWNVYGFCIYQ